MSDSVVIQLARLGDVLQMRPALSALHALHMGREVDMVCATPLVEVAAQLHGVGRVIPWDGEEWSLIAAAWEDRGETAFARARAYAEHMTTHRYACAYNVNNHPRAMVLAHLLASSVKGVGEHGPLSTHVPPWGRYLQLVAAYRGDNRVHLSDAFCGLCGVRPPAYCAPVVGDAATLPRDLREFSEADGPRVALVLGAGDIERRIPLPVWVEWIETFLRRSSDGRVVLIGGPGEQSVAHALIDRVAPIHLGRLWNACGRTTLVHVMGLLASCSWVVGSDTGPLHLGVACGATAVGLYFARARVHETGPYGDGHWVWQAESTGSGQMNETHDAACEGREAAVNGLKSIVPESWPVHESVDLMLDGACSMVPEGWRLWKSHTDAYGANYTDAGVTEGGTSPYREWMWQQMESGCGVDWDEVARVVKGDVSAPEQQMTRVAAL